jgi:hypothetical protein
VPHPSIARFTDADAECIRWLVWFGVWHGYSDFQTQVPSSAFSVDKG